MESKRAQERYLIKTVMYIYDRLEKSVYFGSSDVL